MEQNIETQNPNPATNTPVATDSSFELALFGPPLQHWSTVLHDRVLMRSLIYFVVALLAFGFQLFGQQDSGSSFFGAAPIVTFGMVWIATIDQIVNKRLRWLFFARPEHYSTYFVLLATWLVSCFALNKFLPIFQTSCLWLSVYLCIGTGSLLAFGWWNSANQMVRQVITFCLAAMAVLMLYYSVFLLPITILGTVVTWFFGLSFHAYIPLIMVVTLIRHLSQSWGNTRFKYAAIAGFSIPLAILIGFNADWANRNSAIKSAMNAAKEGKSAGLPAWVVTSQLLSRSYQGQLWLKSMVSYVNPRDWGFGLGFISNNSNGRVHDPLVFIASAFFPVPTLAQDDRTKILRNFFDKRHDTEERLWSDNFLRTQSIQTYMEVVPQQRLAYIEKELTIRNTGPQSSTQEATYSFHLPEGGVVSSLSLWVNGVEEKSRLSARSTADKAYKEIVGVERRDPSIVHWQEGNRVTLKVFPCTPAEDRKFKIGVTAPLVVDGDMLQLENVVFEGPSATDTDEQISVAVAGPAEAILNAPKFLKRGTDGRLTGAQRYAPGFSLQFKNTPVQPASFSFQGHRYTASEYNSVVESFSPSAVYLDINAAWSRSEVEQALQMSAKLPVKIWYQGQWLDLRTESGTGPIRSLRANRFSMFPFHLMPDAANALVISKSEGFTPTLDELRETEFGTRAQEYFTNNRQPIRVWHIGHDLTNYLRSLHELRLLTVHTGAMEELGGLLAKGQYYLNPEIDGSVVIPNSRLRITRQADTNAVAITGNDHLMRMFAYNDVMRQVGANYWTKKFEPEPLVRQAEAAFVVTPVSSLIVLESQADYERFDIKENQNTLGNAAKSGGGAVPEPHEWALLLLLVLALWRFRTW
jgi:XrtN system VIT domain protein